MSFNRPTSHSGNPSFAEHPSLNGPPSFAAYPSLRTFPQGSSKSLAAPHSGYICPSYNTYVEVSLLPKDLNRIPFSDINQATKYFAEENIIEKSSGWIVYKGELFGKKSTFVSPEKCTMINIRHLVMISSLPKHKNIVSFIGCCDIYSDKVILVLEHPTRGGLHKYVRGTHLTWLMRLGICLDIASGLHYFQNHDQTREMKIEDLNSASIHLDENWQAKISMVGTLGYVDPLYIQTGVQSEIYSFGVMLFELLCARLAVTYDEEGGTQFLSKLACSHYEQGTLTEIIDPVLRVQMNRDSIAIFSEVAYRCLNEDPTIRPTILVVIAQLQKVLKLQQEFELPELEQVQNIKHMKIPSEEIRLASRDSIGNLYKANLSHFNVDKYVAENKIKRVSMEEILKYPRIKSTVAIKSIDGGYGQQTEERLQKLLYLSHENLVKIVGFCDEDAERIHVVYEYASNGSLEAFIHSQHNTKTHKTKRNMFPWVMRLQFCLEAARGLNFLHNGNTKNQTIIHGNIKSSNILISRDGVGMIGDFPLSTTEYSDTHRLTEKYDVYSFGLVLFEVMNGRLTHFKISKDDPELLPDIVKRGSDKRNLKDIIDPMIKQEFHTYHASFGRSAESLNIFADIAYRCFNKEVEGRPAMADIVKKLEEAYGIHVESLELRQTKEDISKMENLEHLKIPFKEIYLATNGFADSCMIGWGGFGGVYRAELFHIDVRKYVGKKESLVELYGYPRRKGKVALKRREITSDQGRKEFWKEIDVLSGLNHRNIISVVGFCYEYGEMIIIYDYASNGSFDRYIQNIQNLKWEQRLQICIDAAQGLNYLHNHHIIHRDVKSGNILLGGSYEGVIGDVGLSITINSADSQLIVDTVGTHGYVDPIYLTSGILTKQSDMYSFGVVLLEVLCGKFATTSRTVKEGTTLVDMTKIHLLNNQPSDIIDDRLRKDLDDEKFMNSVKTFAAIIHECLHSTQTRRLTMADVLKELKNALTVHLTGSKTISLEDVKSATNHFSKEHVIGSGASGKVYKGEIALFKKAIAVAVKRIDRPHSYQEGVFLKEVVKLSRYVHENIITLRGFCDEGEEKIIIVDHAINGSLDKHLHKSTLTWGRRLEISIGAAKGLNHIHSFEENKNTIHGDIKSSNILLDHDWKAAISDFIVSKNKGTLGYLDPQYSSSGATKEADVYSFGVVLFELLSGRLAVDKVENYSHHTLRQLIEKGDEVKDKKVVFLAWMATRCFEEENQHALVLDDIKEQTDAKSIDIFSEVAYECLQKDQEKRPTMALVIHELEKALDIHVDWEFEQKLPKDNENILKMIEHWESKRTTKKDLYSIFSSGIRLTNGKVWLSINKDEKVKEMISATTLSYENCWSSKLKVLENSRFGIVARISDTSDLKIPVKIKTQFLSLGIIYGAYLVFKFCDPNLVSDKPYVNLKYRTASGKLSSRFAERRDGEWMIIELCRFWSHNQTVDFELQLKSFYGHPCGSGPIFVDGIEFRPIDNGGHEKSVDRLINVDSRINWDQQSLRDFQEIMTRSQYDLPTLTKQELDKLLSTGVLIDNGQKLFSLSKVNCKKCHMLPAKAVITKSPDAKFTKCPSSTMSRFEEVVELQRHQAFSIKCHIETKMLSPDIAYACYLVFQLPVNCEGLKCPVKTRDILNKNNKESTFVYLIAPGLVDLYRDKRVPDRREDGWMEVRVWEFFYNNEIKDKYIPMELKLACLGGTMAGLIICGVEFRPLYFKFNFINKDHASNESLVRHLDKSSLRWGIRLKISIGAAKGLNYIHSFEEDQKTVHGDIKSSNIMLDHDWEATISNIIVSKSHGTLGYLDPQSYRGVTKASDVYSFGVVLCEILSGKLAIEKAEKYSHHTLRQIINNERERYAGDGAEYKKVVFLAWMAARCFEENKLEALIFDDLMEQTDAKSIDVVSKVAYQCLHKDQEKRPTMAFVIQELERAYNIHEEWEFEQKLPEDYERIMKMIENPESQIITKKDLYSLLSSGTRLNNGEVWLSLSKDRKVNEMISATTFSYENCLSFEHKVLENSRFGTVANISDTQNLKIPINIQTRFLSLGVIYGVYLVFRFSDATKVSSEPYVNLEYSIAGEGVNSFVVVRRDDGWMMLELFRFRNHNQITEFKAKLESFWGNPCGSGPIFVDGIEFRPIDNVEREESVERSINADSSINWVQRSSSDFQEIMKRSQYDVLTMTKHELDKLLFTGVLIDNGEKFFSLSKVNFKKCHMLPAKAVKPPDAKVTKCPSSAMSRFEEVVELRNRPFNITCDIETQMLSPDTAYACYLLFQLPEYYEGLKCPVEARDLLNKSNKESTSIYLRAPGLVDLYRDKRVPNRREDGWMEVRVWEFFYNNEYKDNYIPMKLNLVSGRRGTMSGLVICGIEFRPL